MSGVIDIVGLALTIFPLVISLLENYEKGYDGLKDWICFRREFTHLVNDLKREQILFGQQIEGMLRSITDSDFDMKGMMYDLQSDWWKNPELVLRLQQKLCGDGEFESYSASIHSIYTNLDKMAKKLKSCEPPDKSPDGTSQGGFYLQKKFRKLQFSVRKKRWQEQVIDLGRQIDRVGKLLGEAEALAPARQSRSSTISQVFEQAKSQASSLHKAITKGWTCSCKDHAFKLVLDRSKIGGPLESGSRVFKVSFPLRSRMWGRAETLLHQKDEWYTSDTMMISNFDNTDTFLTKAEQTERSSSISAVSGSSLGPPSSIFPASSSSLTPSLSTAATTEMTMPSGLRSRKVSFQESERSRKESPSGVTVTEKPLLISDLCHTIQTRGKETCLGYLEDGQGSYHIFHTSLSFSFTSVELDRVISLGAVLEQKARGKLICLELSRRDRLSIALTLSHALLELYPTPWLPRHWSKTDVYFFQRQNGEIITENPFVLCETVPTKDHFWPKAPVREENFHDHTDALLSLGILIMELWFGEAIESRTFWKKYCDDKGNENRLTSLMAAIEWQKQAKDEAGVALHDITHRCILGNFGMTAMNLDDEKCVGAVYDGVVKPLEGLLGYFWPV